MANSPLRVSHPPPADTAGTGTRELSSWRVAQSFGAQPLKNAEHHVAQRRRGGRPLLASCPFLTLVHSLRLASRIAFRWAAASSPLAALRRRCFSLCLQLAAISRRARTHAVALSLRSTSARTMVSAATSPPAAVGRRPRRHTCRHTSATAATGRSHAVSSVSWFQ